MDNKHPTSLMFYVEFGVVLVAEKVDPNTVAESFLRQHSIIQIDDVLSQPAVLTPVFSQLLFKNQLSIIADPCRLLITQKGDNLDIETNRCSEIVLKYLDCVPLPSFTAIGINFKGVMPNSPDDRQDFTMNRFFMNGADWLKFGDIDPELRIKAVYHGDERTINLDVGRAIKKNDSSFSGIFPQVNFHRDLVYSSLEQMKSNLTEILHGWNRDLDDFGEIVSDLYRI